MRKTHERGRPWRRATTAVVVLTAGLASLTGATGASGADAETTPYMDASLPVQARVDDLLSRMTLAEKVGQMTQTERLHVSAEGNEGTITTLGYGSILSGGGSTPAENTPEAWADMIDGFQRQALATRLKIPMLYGIDAVHGNGNALGATVFPHNIGLGATRDPDLVRDIAHVTAEETRAIGIPWTFAPCICAARDDRWGRTYESFSENPALVERLETAIDGYQGEPGHLADRDRVLATAKHYAGDGSTVYGTSAGDYKIDQGVSQTSREDFWETSLRQYVPAVQEHHVGSVMPSFSSVDWTEDGLGNPIKMHANEELISGVLKRDMGFDGFVVSDWEGIHQIPTDAGLSDDEKWAVQVRTGVNAGIDMMMEPNTPERFITALTAEVQAGRVSMARIDDAVSRILTKKFELGLFEHPFADRTNIGRIGSAEHHALARKAAAKSQVLLKNTGKVLPIKTSKRVYVAGSNADNIGNQAGGWTLTWQGGSKNVIPGTTILDGIREQSDKPVTFSETAALPVPKSAVGVVVVGETPYAEGFGDVGGPQWGFDPADMGVLRPKQTMLLNDADKAAIDKVCTAVKKCAVVVVSGRPLIIDPAQRRHIDALVAAWLPGSEGAGVADTLFGAEPFTGKLSFTWPRSLDQEPINIGDEDYDPLYEYGHGLKTKAR
jgi:beta-glucosidase